MRFRPLVCTAIALAFPVSPGAVSAQSPDDADRWSSRRDRADDSRSMPVAILIRNPDRAGGAPPYALADQYGQSQRFVEASPRINLDRYLGRRVRVRHDTGMTLLPSQLELPAVSSSDRPPRRLSAIDASPLPERSPVEPAAYTDPRSPRVASLDRLRSTSRRRGLYRTAQAGDLPGPGGDAIDLGRARYEVLPGSDLPPVDLPEAEVTDSAVTGDASAEPIDLDRLLAEEAGDLPPPSDAETLEPIPAGEPYYEGATTSRARSQKFSPSVAACPDCNQPCANCGQQWCGPTCNPPSTRGPYGRAEYLLWWTDGFDTPPLATTNDNGGSPALGVAGTRTVYGGELLDDTRSGLRLSGGYWFDDRRDLALELDWLALEDESDAYAFSDPLGTSVLGRPFYNAGLGAADAALISSPGLAGGDLQISAGTEFTTAGIRARTGLCCREIGGGCDSYGCRDDRLGGVLGGAAMGRRAPPRGVLRTDLLIGYRYARLRDSLRISQSVAAPPLSTSIDSFDAFDTRNEFHGLDLGAVYDWQATRWGLELVGRVAVGSTEQRVAITGDALFAQPGNTGIFSRDRFSVLPELSARLGYRVTPRLSVNAAYTLVYWANVVRPGDQLDVSAVTGGPVFAETSFWSHGLSLGADYRY